MYHVNEFTWTPRNNHLRVEASYTTDTFPEGRVMSRHGNAVRISDPARPDVEIIVSRPWADGSVYPLPLYDEDLSWAFGTEARNIWTTFDRVTISGATHRWWKHMRRSGHGGLLDEAAAHIEECDADPWVFAADWRHFMQFADDVDWGCYETMNPEALYVLMGQNLIAVDDALEEGDVRL